MSVIGWSLGGSVRARIGQTVAGNGPSGDHVGVSVYGTSARDERVASIRVRQRPSDRVARFSWAAQDAAARADDVDLEPERRNRVLALQRRDAPGPGGEYRCRFEPLRPRGAPGCALCDRRPARAAGRPLAGLSSKGLAASRLSRCPEVARSPRRNAQETKPIHMRWSWSNNPDPSNVHGSLARPSSASIPSFAVMHDPRATSSCRPCPPKSAEAPRQRRLSPGSRSSR